MSIILSGNREVTASQIIKRALRLLKVYGPGAVIPGEEIADNLSVLNSMLDYLSQHGLIIPARTTENFALTALDSVYTIGSNGDFDTTRPMSIDARASYIRDSNNYDYPLLPMDEREYNSISDKSPTTGTYPERIWFDPQYPLANIALDPAPQSGLTLYLVSEKPFNAFSSVSDAIEFPPGYQSALEYNLAQWLQDEYDAKLSDFAQRKALETLAAISARNVKPIKNTKGFPAGQKSGTSLADFMSGDFR